MNKELYQGEGEYSWLPSSSHGEHLVHYFLMKFLSAFLIQLGNLLQNSRIQMQKSNHD